MEKSKFLKNIKKEIANLSLIEKEDFIFSTIAELEDNEKKEEIAQLAQFCVDNHITYLLTYTALMWLLNEKTAKFVEYNDENDSDEINRRYLWENIFDYLWDLKGAIPKLPYLEINKDVINSAISEMEFHYKNWSISKKMVYKTIMLTQMAMNNKKEAIKNYKLWQKTEDDFMNDCEACELTEQVNYLSFIGEHEEALELAKPLINKELTCAEVPAITYAPVIKSLIALSEFDKAKSLLKKATKDIIEIKKENETLYYRELNNFILLAAQLEDYDFVEKYTNYSLNYTLNNLPLFDRLKLTIANSKHSEEYYDLALELASYFDERNDNYYYTTLLAEISGRKKVKKLFFKK